MGLLNGSKGSVEGHLVAGFDHDGAGETCSQNGGVERWRHRAGHLSSGTQNGTEVSTDEPHVRDFGEEEIVLVGDLFRLSLLATEILDVLGENGQSSGLGLGGGLACGEHGDLQFSSSAGRKANLFLDTVGRVLQVDVFDGERNVHRFDKFALRSRFNGGLDGFTDFFFHVVSPRRSARPKPLPQFVIVQLKRSSHSPFAMISRASLAQ